MAFTKFRYDNSKIRFRLTVEDCDGGLLEKWVVMEDDFPDLARIIFKKYGMKIGKENSDLNWLK